MLDALAQGASADVALAGTGGRYAVGYLLTRRVAAQLMLEEVADERHRLGARWVMPKAGRGHHIWGEALGFHIDGEARKLPARSPTSAAKGSFEWHVRPGEDLLLHSYWQRSSHPGTLWVEVSMPDDGRRKMDGVLVHDAGGRVGGRSIHWDGIGEDTPVEVIEVKQMPKHDTKSAAENIEMVIGQVAAARAGVAWRLDRTLSDVRATALTENPVPAALSRIADALDIRVAGVAPSRLVQIALHPEDPLWDQIRQRAEQDRCSTDVALRSIIAGHDD